MATSVLLSIIWCSNYAQLNSSIWHSGDIPSMWQSKLSIQHTTSI